MNPTPDAELASVGEYNHNWVVDAVADFIFKHLENQIEAPTYRWDSMLNLGSNATKSGGESAQTARIKAAPKAKATRAKKVVAEPAKEAAPKRTRTKKAAE